MAATTPGTPLTPKWSELTAILGGTFDPPHLGHLAAARGLLRMPGVKRVILMPAGDPPLKTARTTAQHRLAMAKLLVAKNPEIQVSSFEIDRATRLPGQPSYTADTLEALRPELGEIAFVMGTDQLALLPKWHRFPEVLALAHWIILGRQGHEATTQTALAPLLSSGALKHMPTHQGLTQFSTGRTTLTLVPTEAEEMSSTQLRESLELGKTPVNLTEEVFHYLKTHRLYGTW